MTDLPTIQLEAKKDGLQQLQNGSAKLTLTVNAEDMNAAIGALWAAPMGTRYQVVMVEIGDDEEPVDRSEPKPGDPVKSVKGYAKPPMTEAQRCGVLCTDPAFQVWLEQTYPSYWRYVADGARDATDTAAATVRQVLCLTSRKELDDPTFAHARAEWESMVLRFQTVRLPSCERTPA